MHYTFIACIDSVMRIEEKNFPHVYLEECKYKIKKKNKCQDLLILNKSQIQCQSQTQMLN